jgi:tight adherence protein C
MARDVLGLLVIVFTSVGVLTAVVAWTVLSRRPPARRRLRQLIGARRDAVWHETMALTDAPKAWAERVCRVLPRSDRRMDEMRQRLVAAGYRSQAAPAVFAASQIVSAVLVGAVAFFASGKVALGLLSAIAGFMAPGFWLSQQIDKRARVIRNGLPDVLDLLIVCLESGTSLDQAVLKTGEELGAVYKPVGDELALVANEIRAGKPRTEALRRFADRTGITDVRSLVSMLVQTDRYGTSIGQALRIHAEQLRTQRRQRAEERAAKASVKLVFPLVFCLFPAFYLIALGPAILQFLRVFLGVVDSVK